MGEHYDHLSEAERSIIWHYHAIGYSNRRIGRQLCRDKKTIKNELERNQSDKDSWQSKVREAQRLSEERKSRANSHPKITESAKEYLQTEIPHLRLSPLLVAGRMKLAKREDAIGKDAIYRWIRKDARELLEYLPRHGKRKHCAEGRRRKKKVVEVSVPKVSISERPEILTIGNLEGDTMHGKKGKSVLSVYVDKTSKRTFLEKIPSTSSEEFEKATLKVLEKFPSARSLTLDNGPECACYPTLSKHIDVFFCAPYHSWEKGTVENRIQVLRLFVPKGYDIDLLSDTDVRELELKINSRPMECLNFETPLEAHNRLLQNYL
jgi:transposase, IS30 family